MFTVQYKPGSQNIADPLSRLVKPSDHSHSQTHSSAEQYIYFVTKSSVPSAMTMHELEEATDSDPELMALRHCIQTNKWEDCQNQALKDEFTCYDKLVLQGSRIVVPKTLRQRVIEIAHEGHQGIVKTKERLRSKVWWPGMDRDTEKLIKACHECQIGSQPSPEPLMRRKLPDGPGEDLAMDLGPLPPVQPILVVGDYYSRYLETAILRSSQFLL